MTVQAGIEEKFLVRRLNDIQGGQIRQAGSEYIRLRRLRMDTRRNAQLFSILAAQTVSAPVPAGISLFQGKQFPGIFRGTQIMQLHNRIVLSS